MIISKFKFERAKDAIHTNMQDQPEWWFSRYEMMFPPNLMNDRVSAHFLEINHIFAYEMLKRYQSARKELLAEREAASQKDRQTKYITNPNYVFEELGPDSDGMKTLKETGYF